MSRIAASQRSVLDRVDTDLNSHVTDHRPEPIILSPPDEGDTVVKASARDRQGDRLYRIHKSNWYDL